MTLVLGTSLISGQVDCNHLVVSGQREFGRENLTSHSH